MATIQLYAAQGVDDPPGGRRPCELAEGAQRLCAKMVPPMLKSWDMPMAAAAQ